MNPAFWRNKSVFVTGHSGFKGSWLCLLLERAGARVTGFSRPSVKPKSLFQQLRFHDVHSIEGDVRDLAALEQAYVAAQPDIVLHLAAQALVRPSYVDPVETISTNVLGTTHLLEAARRHPGARAIVVVTSDKCYENREWYWSYREKSALGGRDPYSASKACAELVTVAYRRSFFDPSAEAGTVAVASARAGNVIGGGDWSIDRLVPDTIRALVHGQPVALRYPNAIRPWQHVLEPLYGYLSLAEHLYGDGGGKYAESWNFSPQEDDARPVGWLVDRIQRRWGIEPAWRPQEGAQPHEHIFLKLDSSKARAHLGWRSRLGIEETVDWVTDWYHAEHQGGDARALCEDSIAFYDARA